jgi:uncharacterized protein (TIGR03083 family)
MAISQLSFDHNEVSRDLIDSWRSFKALVESLEESELNYETQCPNWRVRDVVAHIIGIEKMLLGEPVPDVTLDVSPHIKNEVGELNERWVLALANLDVTALITLLSETVLERELALSKMTESDFDKPGWSPVGEVPYKRFMSIRVFDIWTHEQDIREATHRYGNLDTSPARRSYLEALYTMGYVVAKRTSAKEGDSVAFLIQDAEPFSVVVSQGKGIVEDANEGSANCSIITDLATFMRLIAGRVTAKELSGGDRVSSTGDVVLAQEVLDNIAYTI